MQTPPALAELLDRHAIEQVLHRYLFAIDERGRDPRAIDLLLSCFTLDATLSYHNGEVVLNSRDEARDYFENRRGFARKRITVHGCTHALGNLVIEFNERGAQATAHVVVALSGDVDDQPVLMHRGITYTDQFVRQGEQWLIAEREHAPVWHHES